MHLGAFSVSLTVKDIKASKAFYEKIGFKVFGGEEEQNWLIMKNGDHIIGLFQGMFEKNILTFNPGWDQDCQTVKDAKDIRELQKTFKANGIKPVNECDEDSSGPASFILTDPDGNTIMFDQHI